MLIVTMQKCCITTMPESIIPIIMAVAGMTRKRYVSLFELSHSFYFSSISATLWSINRFIRSSLYSVAYRIRHRIFVYGRCHSHMPVRLFPIMSFVYVCVSELSDVLWTMVFRKAFLLNGYFGAVATYILFFVFASLSVSILVVMEGLSAFLHALRLHW